MSLLRTFIAIEASPEVRHGCQMLMRKLKSQPVSATWTRPENLHHTLKFLGDTHDRQLGDICRAMADAAQQFTPFTLETAGVGAFPRLAAPRVVWVGAGAGRETMIALHAAIDEAVYQLGFALEPRRFQPHLTLGRVRKGSHWPSELIAELEANRDFVAGATLVDEVILFSSVLEKEGPHYELLGRAPLGG